MEERERDLTYGCAGRKRGGEEEGPTYGDLLKRQNVQREERRERRGGGGGGKVAIGTTFRTKLEVAICKHR